HPLSQSGKQRSSQLNTSSVLVLSSTRLDLARSWLRTKIFTRVRLKRRGADSIPEAWFRI
ncbi:hypothetical protein CEXT_780491, partial [Caerostris extrusa]